MAKGLLIVLLSNEFLYFLNAKLVYKWTIIVLANQFSSDNFRDIG